MRRVRGLLVLFALMATAGPAIAQGDAGTAIRLVMSHQVEAWNRGDVDSFMHGYKDSPDTTFIGRSVEHGYRMILDRYKKAYATRDAMGTLDFSELAVRMLGPDHAAATGKYHLARTTSGGGDAEGLFSLVFEKTPQGWRIILDHTS